MSKRNIKIDIIKIIGLLAVILAHTKVPNQYIFQLRNFDVALLVFVSGYLSYSSFSKTNNYFEYLWKRIKRLIIPTWIFLIIYFCILLFNNHVFGITFPYNLSQIKDSFLLLEGIGYIWVVRVYFLTALIVPFLIKIIEKYNIKLLYIFIILGLLLNELLVHYRVYFINDFVYYYIAYLIGYGLIAFLGLLCHKTKENKSSIICIVWLGLYILLYIYYYKKTGHFFPTQERKYPPSIYYFSYAMFITYLLFSININLKINNYVKKIIEFISKSSFWIYLWHIYYIYLFDVIIKNGHWLFRYVFIIICSFLTVYIQNKILDIIEKRKNEKINKILKIFRG